MGRNEAMIFKTTTVARGDGQRLAPIDYMVWKDQVNVLDQRRIFQLLAKGPRLDTYPHLLVVVKGSDAGALMRRLDDGKNTKDGKPGNMHAHLGSTDAERGANLETFKKWVGGWTLKRKKELGKEELEAIKAPEK